MRKLAEDTMGVRIPCSRTLIFIEKNVKVIATFYVEKILKSIKILTSEHFLTKTWTLQQDNATSLRAKIFARFLQKEFYSIVTKEMCPLCFPELNPLDFLIWRILEKAV